MCLETPQEKERMKYIPYASIVEDLMYVMMCIRPAIYFAVRMVSRY